jgi:hypothetical protein
MQQVVALSAAGLDFYNSFIYFIYFMFFSLVLTRKAREIGVTGGESFYFSFYFLPFPFVFDLQGKGNGCDRCRYAA